MEQISAILASYPVSVDISSPPVSLSTWRADAVCTGLMQVQKYENGLSRVTIDRLQQIANALNVPVAAFLDEEAASTAQALTADIKEDEAQMLILYRRITRQKLRDSLLNMIEDLVQIAESRQ